MFSPTKYGTEKYGSREPNADFHKDASGATRTRLARVSHVWIRAARDPPRRSAGESPPPLRHSHPPGRRGPWQALGETRRRAKCDEGSMRAPRVCLGGGGLNRLTPGGRERGAAAKRARRVTCAFWGTCLPRS